MASLFYSAVVLFMCCAVIPCMGQTVYTVGDSNGWSLMNVDYSSWSLQNNFYVGDSLQFNYAPGGHSVLEVSLDDYDSCNTGNPISSDASGNTIIPLSTAGTRFFICGVPNHCMMGMKFGISVSNAPSETITSPPPPSGVGFFPTSPPPPDMPFSGERSLPVPPPPPCEPLSNSNVTSNTSSSSVIPSPLFALGFAILGALCASL